MINPPAAGRSESASAMVVQSPFPGVGSTTTVAASGVRMARAVVMEVSYDRVRAAIWNAAGLPGVVDFISTLTSV